MSAKSAPAGKTIDVTDAHEVPPISRATADIVSAYLAHNSLPPERMVGFIEEISQALQACDGPVRRLRGKAPADIKASVQPDHIVCLEDGKKLKMLKRHLRVYHKMSPEEYRAKWGLSDDYPMVAPNYARRRAEIARKTGLSRLGRTANAHQRSEEAPQATLLCA